MKPGFIRDFQVTHVDPLLFQSPSFVSFIFSYFLLLKIWKSKKKQKPSSYKYGDTTTFPWTTVLPWVTSLEAESTKEGF